MYKKPTPKHYKKIAKDIIKTGKLIEKHCEKCHYKLYRDITTAFIFCKHCGYSNHEIVGDYLKRKK